MIDQKRIDDLVCRLSESLNVEIKQWFDLSSPEGIAKLVKAVLALRNRNGGFFVIGFTDDLAPDETHRPDDIRSLLTVDNLQGLVSKYSSEVFEVELGFGVRDGYEYPVIAIPEGLTAPVAAKRALLSNGGKHLIQEGDVYFRTLESNGTPSTAKARSGDWRAILEICFENREADIGRFIRRHLAGIDAEAFVKAVSNHRDVPIQSLRNQADALLIEDKKRCEAAISERHLDPEQEALLKHGWSVALIISPPKADAVSNREFLNNEPHRVCRRLFRLSHAAMSGCSSIA